MLDTTQNCCTDLDWPWITNCSQILPQLPKNFTKYFPKPSLSKVQRSILPNTNSLYPGPLTLSTVVNNWVLWCCRTTVGRKLYLGGMTKKIFPSGIIFLGYKINFQKSGGHMPPAPSSCSTGSIWFRSDISSEKDFEILWKFVIFQIFISTVLSNLHSTDPPHVLLLSPTVLKVSLHSTVGIPHSTDVIPPHALMLSPTVLNNLHNTEGIPHSTEAILHIYCCYYPTVLKVSLYSTEYPPQYWCYLPQYWCYPLHVLMLSSIVLSNLHSTEAIPHSTEVISWWTEQPPMYWTTSTELNRRYMGWLQPDLKKKIVS